MGKTTLLKSMLLLCALVVGSTCAWADSETITFSTLGYTNGQSVSSVSGTNINIAFTDGTTATAYYTTGTGIRIYGGGSATFTAGTGTVTKVELTFSADSYAPSDASNRSTTGKTSATSGASATWEGSASSVSLSRPTGSGHWRMQSVKVTYTPAGGGSSVDQPTFSPAAGAVNAGTAITITQASADAIRYTLDGTDPTKTTGTEYSDPIVITTGKTIKAIAIEGDKVSSVATAIYTINVTAPSFDPYTGSYPKGTTITLTSSGNTIYYTTNGDTPTSSSTEYTAPIVLTESMTVKAIAVDKYGNESAVRSATYTAMVPGQVDITPNYTFFGKDASFSGESNDEVTGTTTEGITVTYTRNGSSLYANSSAMRVYQKNTIKFDAPAGKTITDVIFTQSNDVTDNLTVSTGEYTNVTHTWSGNASSITFTRPNASTSYLQFTKISIILAPIVSVGGKGYATYCNSEYALDFTGKSIKAYTISSTDGSALTLTQKNKVAKNEPVLLYSSTNGDSQTIPVIADAAATATVGNKLVKGDNAAHTWVEGTAEHYVLATATVEPGFYRANNNTVSSTKAYLDLTGLAPGAHSFTLDLGEGDVTGIANVNVEKNTMNGTFYNLAGQRVNANHKGIVVVNGKKFVNK